MKRYYFSLKRLMQAVPYVFASLFLSACATTYQPRGVSGGFSETQLDKNVFRVSFNGNGFTNRERVYDFTLLRSAELTLKNGYTHFVIVNGKAGTDYSTFTTPTRSTTNATVNVYGNTAYGSATTTTTPGETFVVQKPSATNTIVCLDSKPDGVFAYDADFIFRSLTQKYGLQKSR